MPFRVSGKNIEVGEALRERISARVLESLEKYFDGGFSGHVTVGKEAFGFHTECVVHLDSGIVLRADSMAADAYLSADQAADNLEKRLRRYHRRLKDYHGNGRGNGRTPDDVPVIDAPSYVIAAPEQDSEDDVATFNPVIIAEFDHRAEAALGERSRHRARHDGCGGHGFSPCQSRPRQSGVSPRGRQCGLDRSSRHPGRRQLTGAIDGRRRGPYKPGLPPSPMFEIRLRTGSMPTPDLVSPNAIIPALKVNGKKQALQEIAAKAADAHRPERARHPRNPAAA